MKIRSYREECHRDPIAQNPLIGSLIRKKDIGRNDVFSKLLTKAPNPKDIKIKSRLDALRNSRNNSGLNSGDSPSFPPPPLPPPPPPRQPPQPPRNNLIPPPNPFTFGPDFSNISIPSPPPPPQFFPTDTKTNQRGMKKYKTNIFR